MCCNKNVSLSQQVIGISAVVALTAITIGFLAARKFKNSIEMDDQNLIAD